MRILVLLTLLLTGCATLTDSDRIDAVQKPLCVAFLDQDLAAPLTHAAMSQGRHLVIGAPNEAGCMRVDAAVFTKTQSFGTVQEHTTTLKTTVVVGDAVYGIEMLDTYQKNQASLSTDDAHAALSRARLFERLARRVVRYGGL